MHVIFGFYEKKIISAISDELTQMDVDFDFSYCKTKLDVLKCVQEEEKIDAIVLFRSMKFDGNWSDFELSRLTDGREINVIPLLDADFRGTEFMKMLYAAGITSAILDSVTPKEVAKLIVNKRERNEAKKYYGIRDDECYLSLDRVSDDKAKVYLGMLEDADKNGNVPEVFDNICSELNKKQVENLIERSNYRLKELCRKSNTYMALNETARKATPFSFKITKFDLKKKKNLKLLYGFDSENFVKHIEGRLKNSGFVIDDSITKYSKEGIKTYLKNNDVTDAVIIENLEARGGYEPEEVVELKMLKDINIVMTLTQKKGSLYLNKLYCSGVLNSIIGNVSVSDVSRLIVNERCRSETREYYGLEIGGIYVPKICDKYKDCIITYLNRGNGKLRDKFSFVESLLSKEQLSDVTGSLPENLKQALIANGVIDDPDRKKGLFAILDNKNKKDVKRKNEELKIKKNDKSKEQDENIYKPEEKSRTDVVNENAGPQIDLEDDNMILRNEKTAGEKEAVIINDSEKEMTDNLQDASETKSYPEETKKVKAKRNKPERHKPDGSKNGKKKFVFIIITIVVVVALIIVFKFVLAGSDETFEPDKNDDLVVVPEIVTDVDMDSYDTNGNENEAGDEVMTDDVPETAAEDVPETVVQVVTDAAMETVTAAEEEITTIAEETTQPETTRKRKKHKKEENVTTTTKAVQTTTEKQTRSIGSYSEKNDISSSKISIIRNSVIAKFSGSSSSEKGNLAKYMSANKLSDANATYKKLTDASKQFSVKTCTVTVDTASQDSIVKAAEKASSAIGSVSSDYGIGISSFEQTVGFKIYIVVVY